jgi:8-amino-7-oxononanoate synthase
MSQLMKRMQALLDRRKKQAAFRQFSDLSHLEDFSSNDYLSLARNSTLKESIHQESKTLALGSTGSRLLSGHYPLLSQLEQQLAYTHQAEAALVFNSGYNANLSLLTAIPRKSDLIFYDNLVHASIHDGLHLSKATAIPFPHNDTNVLAELLLQHPSQNVFVMVESIYSMDGDAAPLLAIQKICEKHKAHLIVDEAHSTGAFGLYGGGLCVQLGIQNKVFARVHTFGKAIGSHGAAVVGSTLLKEYLTNFARPLIYTTALSPHSVLTTLKNYAYLQQQGAALIEAIQNKITFFKKTLPIALHPYHIPSDSPIQTIQIKGNDQVVYVATQLQRLGFDIRPIRSPTVAVGTERLRICLHLHNTEEQISNLIHALSDLTN